MRLSKSKNKPLFNFSDFREKNFIDVPTFYIIMLLFVPMGALMMVFCTEMLLHVAAYAFDFNFGGWMMGEYGSTSNFPKYIIRAGFIWALVLTPIIGFVDYLQWRAKK